MTASPHHKAECAARAPCADTAYSRSAQPSPYRGALDAQQGKGEVTDARRPP